MCTSPDSGFPESEFAFIYIIFKLKNLKNYATIFTFLYPMMGIT